MVMLVLKPLFIHNFNEHLSLVQIDSIDVRWVVGKYPWNLAIVDSVTQCLELLVHLNSIILCWLPLLYGLLLNNFLLHFHFHLPTRIPINFLIIFPLINDLLHIILLLININPDFLLFFLLDLLVLLLKLVNLFNRVQFLQHITLDMVRVLPPELQIGLRVWP